MALRGLGGRRWLMGCCKVGSSAMVAGLAMASCWLWSPLQMLSLVGWTGPLPVGALGAALSPTKPPPSLATGDGGGVCAGDGDAAATIATNVQYSVMAAVQGLREGPIAELVPAETLFVSEPEPKYFGNPPNEPGNDRWSNGNWLKSRFHFDFAEYRSRDRQRFGVLRVLNDDLVQPRRGFGAHPHRDMEIVTYVVEGHITHQDSTGKKETLGPGSVQFMTAGRGIMHSEHNLGDFPLRLLQLWISPRAQGLTPNYGSYNGVGSRAEDSWRHLVSDVQSPDETPVKVHQDVNLMVCDAVTPQRLTLKPGRQAYALCITGYATIEAADPARAAASHRLRQHDALKLYGPLDISVVPEGAASLLVVEMQQP